MENQIHIQYSHRLEGHFPFQAIDTEFYKTLLGVAETYRNSESGLPEAPIPSVDQVLTVVGTTQLSSESIASSISAWLAGNRTKITIFDPDSDRRIEFQGPNLDKSTSTIKELIEKFVEASRVNQFTIQAINIE